MKKQKGFTLIELLVVISLIGIIIALSFGAYAQSKKGARDAKRKADLEQIRSALEIYRTDCKSYPSTLDTSLIGAEVSCSGNVYMAIVPTDPVSSKYKYHYGYSTTKKTYALCAFLETQDVGGGISECGTNCLIDRSLSCNYVVRNP